MVEVVSSDNNNTINVVSGGGGGSLHISSVEDFYNLSKLWAIYMDGLVENTDYSSKYYALQSKGFQETASAAADSILNNAGFIAVVADLTGNNTIGTVASNIGNVNAVGNDILKVSGVYDDLTNIDSVYSDLAVINTVADNISVVNGVYNNISTISAVNDNETNINIVANNAQNIQTVANNITDIQNAEENAALASQKATAASNSATAAASSAEDARRYAEQSAAGQVNSDWNVTDTTSKAYILNKPDVMTTDTAQSIGASAIKTFNGRVNFIGAGDSNAVYISTDTRFDVYGTSSTILGFANGTFLINHASYNLLLRGKGTRPAYNTASNYLALYSDLNSKQNVSDLVTSISSSSTDTQYPSAKCTYDKILAATRFKIRKWN